MLRNTKLALRARTQVRPAAYAFWIRGKVVAEFDDPNIYSVRLSNGVLDVGVSQVAFEDR